MCFPLAGLVCGIAAKRHEYSSGYTAARLVTSLCVPAAFVSLVGIAFSIRLALWTQSGSTLSAHAVLRSCWGPFTAASALSDRCVERGVRVMEHNFMGGTLYAAFFIGFLTVGVAVGMGIGLLTGLVATLLPLHGRKRMDLVIARTLQGAAIGAACAVLAFICLALRESTH